jgi:hypothetical protein
MILCFMQFTWYITKENANMSYIQYLFILVLNIKFGLLIMNVHELGAWNIVSLKLHYNLKG